MSSEEYLIRFPHSLNELIYEGSTMHHCVASYADRIIAGTSIIFFMRKADKPDEPYITMNLTAKAALCRHGKAIMLIKQFQKNTLIPEIRSKAA